MKTRKLGQNLALGILILLSACKESVDSAARAQVMPQNLIGVWNLDPATRQGNRTAYLEIRSIEDSDEVNLSFVACNMRDADVSVKLGILEIRDVSDTTDINCNGALANYEATYNGMLAQDHMGWSLEQHEDGVEMLTLTSKPNNLLLRFVKVPEEE